MGMKIHAELQRENEHRGNGGAKNGDIMRDGP